VTAFMAGMAAGLTFGSLTVGVLAGLVTSTTVLLSPLKPDDTDPITFRKKRRKAGKVDEV